MTTKTQKRDLYQETTDKIVDLLEQGVAPWKCTWSKYGLARNYASGHVYTGINMLLMNLTPHPIPYFLSYKQAKALGGNIRKGAKSAKVYFYNVFFKDANDNKVSEAQAREYKTQGKELKVQSYIKCYSVFNIEDVENVEYDIPEISLQSNERIAKCDSIISNMPNAPKLGTYDSNRAIYCPTSDTVNMPDIKRFDNSEEYYGTYFHELTHSTGHRSRLNREGITAKIKKGSSRYAKEELIAEMGASFLCAHADINYDEITENSAAYLQSWLKVLKEDKKFIFKSAAEASKAVDYIMGSS